ncbi:MAG TPA: sugar transferase [Phycisphaerae bacterium]|nr:sugar transferase [Phycisphaerae bacterium]HNU44566.1 sugar transferase [Phycisphaerae bacterium]
MLLVVLDHRPAYLFAGGKAASLLTMPVGGGSLLSHLVDQLAAGRPASEHQVCVVPTFAAGSDYAAAVGADVGRPVQVVTVDEVPRVFAGCEPADHVLLVDSARWPAATLDLERMLREGTEYRAATHWVAVPADAACAREQVQVDGGGCVQRVQRIYHVANWPEAARDGVFLSMAPALALTDANFAALAELRLLLASRGVLSRDVAVPVHLPDLTCVTGLLGLNEAVLSGDLVGQEGGQARTARESLVIGQDCIVDATARLIGPLVLQCGVRVERNATVVGPTVVGAASCVGEGATLAQCVVAPGSRVPAGAAVRQSLVCGDGSAVPVTADAQGAGPEGASLWAAEAALPDRVGQGPGGGRSLHFVAKRALDVAFAATALVALAPLLAAVAIVIKLDSPGPMLFAHRRERRGGKDFPCWKFRTMVADAHQRQRELYQQNNVDGPQFKLRQDPRVTRVGRWLRGTNLDELPQLLNVLLGHMSLVGPRPSPFRENQICVPWRRARLAVPPGITGLWQVCRSEDRSQGDFHEWIYYDLAYIRNFSFWLDLKILAATVVTAGGRWSLPRRWFLPGAAERAGVSEGVCEA